METSPKRNAGPGQSLKFRESRSSDRPRIQEILRDANLVFHEPKECSAIASTEMGATSWYVCERNGEVVAVIQWRNLGEEEEILDVAVHAEHRRQGIARLLLEDFVRVSREHGVRNIFLEVRESNSAAAALYRKAGFSVIARRPNYYRDPVEAALVLRFEVPSG